MLKFGPFVLTRLAMRVAAPCAPTTDSVWPPAQRSRNRTAPWWEGLVVATFIPCDPHAPSRAAQTSRTMVVAATLMRREYIGQLRTREPRRWTRRLRAGSEGPRPAQNPCAV